MAVTSSGGTSASTQTTHFTYTGDGGGAPGPPPEPRRIELPPPESPSGSPKQLAACLDKAKRPRGAARRRAAGERCQQRYGPPRSGEIRGLKARALSGTEVELAFSAPAFAGEPAATSYVILQSSKAIRGARDLRRAQKLCGGDCRFSRRRSAPASGLASGSFPTTPPRLLDAARGRGFAVETAALDMGYDVGPVYEACEARDCRPIIPLRETPAVKAGKASPPTCEHGEWEFAGSDAKRGRSKWRCPTGECDPASRWIKADRLHPLVPRESKRWKSLYRGRAAVEWEFGRLKNEWALLPLRVRGIERVRLHADLTILAKLACALARARAVPLAAQLSV